MRRKINYAAICSAAVLSSLLIGSTAMAREVPKWIAIREDEKDTVWEKLAMTYDGVLTGVNVREKADAESPVIGYIYPGCAVWVIEKGETWTEISSGEVEGFVDNDYLLYGADAQGIAEEYGYSGITANWDGVCVYAEPSGDSEVWGELNTGDDLVVLEDGGHWLTVEYGADKAYVSEDDVQRAFLLDAAYGLDEQYDGDGFEDETEAYWEEEYDEEDYEEETSYDEEENGGDEEYTDPEYVDPETLGSETEYIPPQTDAPQTEAPPQTEYIPPQTDAPQTELPPQTEYIPPETDPPQTDPVQTDPPQTDPVQTEAPENNEGGDVDLGDDGWYDADTDTYYDGNGNVISQGGDGQEEAGEELPAETVASESAEGASDDGDADLGDGGWYDADTDTWYDGNGNVISQNTEGQAEAEESAASDNGDADLGGSGWYDADTDTWYDENGNVVSQGTDEQAGNTGEDVNEDEAALLAALIYCEAGNQSYDGMAAVGSVVMNRVMNENFPDTISDVIYQNGQFSPVDNGALENALENGVPEECYDAAVAALSGECPAGDVLYFNTGTGDGERIDDQQFY